MFDEELKQKIGKNIQDLGINPELLENPAFSYIVNEKIGAMITNMAPIENSPKDFNNNGHLISYKDNYSVYAFDQEIKKDISFRVKKNTDNSFTCTLEIIKDIPDKITKKAKEITEMTVKMSKDGYIIITETISKVNEMEKVDGLLNGNVTCISTAFDGNGIMLKKDTKKYSNLQYKSSIDYISVQDMLYIKDRAFDPLSDFNSKYDYRICINRESFDIAEVIIESTKDYQKSAGYTLLNDTNGLGIMKLPKEYDLNETIEPLSFNEIKQKINNENDYQVRIGLYNYSQDRGEYAYINGVKKSVQQPSRRSVGR